MKNRYVKPAIVECIVVVEEVIAGSTTIAIGSDVESATTDTGRSRGEWGDLWK